MTLVLTSFRMTGRWFTNDSIPLILRILLSPLVLGLSLAWGLVLLVVGIAALWLMAVGLVMAIGVFSRIFGSLWGV